jgi:5-methylcytosine-specific restriction endonuclease McrA
LVKRRFSAWRANNPDKTREGRRRQYKNNSEGAKVSAHNVRARRRAAEGHLSSSDWRKIKELQGGVCFDCGLPKKLTIGHLTPLSKGGTNWPYNIVGQCMECNLKQGASIHPAASKRAA